MTAGECLRNLIVSRWGDFAPTRAGWDDFALGDEAIAGWEELARTVRERWFAEEEDER